MGYTVTFGTMLKRANSTKQLFIYNNSNVACSLKTPCDILAPVFTYQGALTESNNYFYVSEWAKYFWITSLVFDKGHWEITGRLDAMATYKDAIGNATVYVERSASAGNTALFDPLAKIQDPCQRDFAFYPMGFSSAGSYVLGVAGNSGTSYYACSSQQFQALYQKLFSNDFAQAAYQIWDNVAGFFQNVEKIIANNIVRPADYFQSAVWIPYDIITGQQGANIYLGNINTNLTGIPVSPTQVVKNLTYSIQYASHPQAATLGEWLNGQATRKCTLSIPGVGTIPVFPGGALGNDPVTVSLSVDILGGVYACVQDSRMTYLTGSVGCNVGLTDISSNPLSALTNLTGAGISAATGDYGRAIGELVSTGISLIPSVSTIATGAANAIVSATPNITACMTYSLVSTPDYAHMGRPDGTTRQISTLSGYVKCAGAAIAINKATYQENIEINNYLNEGFYYE